MATWTLTATGLPLTAAANSDLIGQITMSGAQPGDFDAAGIIEVRFAWTITATGLSDDSWTLIPQPILRNGGGGTLASLSGNTESGLGNVTRNLNGTDTSGFGSDWSGPLTVGGDATDSWATYQQNMQADGGVLSLTALTVEIDYTPLAPPVASFTASPDTIEAGQSVQFTDTSTGSAISSWSWDFGGGAPGSTEQNPLVTFDSAGSYDVTLTATNAAGSDVSTPMTITVTVPVAKAEVWNGSDWVGAEAWNGSEWVTPEVWNGSAWVPFKVPVEPGGIPAYRSHTYAEHGSVQTITVDKPADVVDGDVLLVYVLCASSSRVMNTVPTGWTEEVAQRANHDYSWGVYSKVASSEPASWDWVMDSSGIVSTVCVAISGASGTIGPVAYTETGSVQSTTVDVGVTTSVANCLLISFTGADPSKALTWTNSSPSATEFVEGQDTTEWLTLAGYHEDAPTAGLYSRTFTSTELQEIHAVVLAVQG